MVGRLVVTDSFFPVVFLLNQGAVAARTATSTADFTQLRVLATSPELRRGQSRISDRSSHTVLTGPAIQY